VRAIRTLVDALSAALEELNPDLIKPHVAALEAYLSVADLAPIYIHLDDFAFDKARLYA